MSTGFKDKNKKFHPIKGSKGIRKKREEPFEVKKTEGVSMAKLQQMQRADVGRRKRSAKFRKKFSEQETMEMMSNSQKLEWEHTIGSEVVKIKHEMIGGRPVTTVRFANGEEWFEFDNIDHQEEFMKENDLDHDERLVGEFIHVDHPMISGFIAMGSGKVLFGEKEDRMKKDGKNISNQITFFEDPSHGYYKVPKKLLIELGIADDITNFSKRSGDNVFLEEDQDATTFFNALKKKGLQAPHDDIKTRSFDTPNENPASKDFGLCDECGAEFDSTSEMMKHKTKRHSQ